MSGDYEFFYDTSFNQHVSRICDIYHNYHDRFDEEYFCSVLRIALKYNESDFIRALLHDNDVRLAITHTRDLVVGFESESLFDNPLKYLPKGRDVFDSLIMIDALSSSDTCVELLVCDFTREYNIDNYPEYLEPSNLPLLCWLIDKAVRYRHYESFLKKVYKALLKRECYDSIRTILKMFAKNNSIYPCTVKYVFCRMLEDYLTHGVLRFFAKVPIDLCQHQTLYEIVNESVRFLLERNGIHFEYVTREIQKANAYNESRREVVANVLGNRLCSDIVKHGVLAY